MQYAELNESGKVLREAFYDPPLPAELIPHFKSGEPVYRELKHETPQFNANNQTISGYTYQIRADGCVWKVANIVNFTAEEIDAEAKRQKQERLEGSLPHWTSTDAAMMRMTYAIFKWIESNRDPMNPLTWLDVSDADIRTIEEALHIHQRA